MSYILTKRLRERRKALGLNQSELAEMAGLTHSAISQFEIGIRKPSFNSLVAISDALDCSADYLFGKIDTPYHDVSWIENDPILKSMADGMLANPEIINTLTDAFEFKVSQEKQNAAA